MAKILAPFFEALKNAASGLALDAEAIMLEVEGQYLWLNPKSFVPYCPMRDRFAARFNRTIRNIAIIPCSSFVPDLVPYFQSQFENVYICDTYKTGQIEGIPIQRLAEVKNQNPDLWFMVTRDPDLQTHFLAQLKDQRVLLAEDFFEVSDVLEMEMNAEELAQVQGFRDVIHAANRPVVVLDAQYFNNYCPTYAALETQGFNVFLTSRREHILYAAPDTRFMDLPFEHKAILNLPQRVWLLQNLERGVVLINHVSYLIPGFDTRKAIASMAYPTALMALAQVPVVLYLYDMVSPITKNLDYQADYLTIYQRMVHQADGLILNSNLPGGQTLLRNSLGLRQPTLSYLRYNESVEQLAEREKDGFHIALVGGMDDDLRDIAALLRRVLAMGLHVHNYVQNHKTEAFIASLSAEEMSFFHNHPSIQDQKALIYEVSRFHAGWILDNTYKWIDLLANIKDPVLRDLMLAFRLSTVTSSQMLLGAAGLPCILNRTMTEIGQHFPSPFFLYLEASELDSLPSTLHSPAWQERLAFCQSHRHHFESKTHIHQLAQFLTPFLEQHP
ncbi:MAG: hypothetical protein H6510_00915 [Acidobacteria bacterium]|nr:hypothetical protein [Acidobacteriota bacterium]MCB9396349.1 hypothetical protein [Acidobacteriota bacterium]